jgi:hypothetical protein
MPAGPGVPPPERTLNSERALDRHLLLVIGMLGCASRSHLKLISFQATRAGSEESFVPTHRATLVEILHILVDLDKVEGSEAEPSLSLIIQIN